ncbi:g1535 [Coccomyxa elongata]
MCAQLLAFVAEHTEPGEARLAGNSVHVDMQFLRRHMPRLFAHLHHRIVDVSTVAELCARWFPADYRNAPRKKGAHTALADVRDSLEELRFYRRAIFKQPPAQQRRRR